MAFKADVIGPENRLETRHFIFQPGHVTGWGSEGVKRKFALKIFNLESGTVKICFEGIPQPGRHRDCEGGPKLKAVPH